MGRNISEVRLLSVPLESDGTSTLYFDSKSDQSNYFTAKTIYYGKDFSYIRKDKCLRYPIDYDDAIKCNYVMYKNKSYTSKWFYAFVTKVEYVNDGMCNIYIETDVLQTWLFDYTVKASFIEREHCSDDTIGIHTIDEGFPIGEYTIADSWQDPTLNPSDDIIVGSTIDPDNPDGADTKVGGLYSGLYSGIKYYKLPRENVTEMLQEIVDKSGQEAINSLFLAPNYLTETVNGSHRIKESASPSANNVTIAKNRNLDGYTPKNNKLFCYPYNYLLVSNGNGGNAIYKYELFSTSNCVFQTLGALSPSCSIRLYPLDYKGMWRPENEGLNLGKYPQCNWATDIYTNWMTQNGVNVGSSILNAGMSMGSAMAVGGGTGATVGSVVPGVGTAVGASIGAVIGAVTQIASSIQSCKNAEMIPPQAQGNTNCGDVVTATNNNTFTYYKMCGRKEYLRIIDGYFTAYGYKVNRFKVPNKNHREAFWFTKTIEANITGDIPTEDMNKIRALYNSGITFWRSTANFLDYTQSNEVI